MELKDALSFYTGQLDFKTTLFEDNRNGGRLRILKIQSCLRGPIVEMESTGWIGPLRWEQIDFIKNEKTS